MLAVITFPTVKNIFMASSAGYGTSTEVMVLNATIF